ncbi:MAG: B12-binding domain-containing radical SAM protein [Candidatus Rifleibacteriota bacterium]
MMRAAIIFSPQWDPRQPPLAPALLFRVLDDSGIETRVFDLNLALYRRLLDSSISGGIEDYLIKRLFDPASLVDAQNYIRIGERVQQLFDERFDPHGGGRLFWDAVGSAGSVNTAAGWQAIIADPKNTAYFKHLEPEINRIISWKPDCLGFSVISDTQLPASLALASFFRGCLPDCRIIFGGAALTYRRSLLAEKSWLSSIADAICLGDGEPFLAEMGCGRGRNELPNALSWGRSQEPVSGPSKIQDMSFSPAPDFSCLPLQNYLTPHLVIPVETARNCPWGRCAYCIHPVRSANGRPVYRPKPMKQVSAEIFRLFAAGHRRFYIVDEAIPPARLRELSNLVQELPDRVSWICYARLDAGHDLEGFKMARASGCRKLFIGVESGSARILKRFNKGVTVETAQKVLLDAATAGLAVHFFLMTGFPQEDASDRQATLDLLARVLPAFEPFGFSFDLFSLSAELETDLMADPALFGWSGLSGETKNDLAWQFPVQSGRTAADSLMQFKAAIHKLADQILGSGFGLRHAGLSQDSLHLLLLEARD